MLRWKGGRQVAYYQFESEWVLTTPIEKVYETLLRHEDFTEWWPSIRKSRLLEEGDADGLGRRGTYSIKSPLFYSMNFDVKITAIERPSMIQISATGDAAGIGRYLLTEHNGGTRVRYLWNVSTIRAWMNFLAPVARPAFVWAYHSVMREGGAGLARYLGGRLISCSSRVLQDQIGAESTPSGVS